MPQGEAKLEVAVADLTTLKVDAIVNAANAKLAGAQASTAPSSSRADHFLLFFRNFRTPASGGFAGSRRTMTERVRV
jgi:hypothetical protein